MNFGKKIRKLRTDNNETQLQVAKAVGTIDRTVRRWESSSVFPAAETVVKLAQHFNVTTDYLLDNAPTVDTVAHSFNQLTSDQQKELQSLINSNDK